jgi:hypothetical protein
VISRPLVAVLLLLVAALGLAAPLVVSADVCEEEGGGDCCGLECAFCVCCAHRPQHAAGTALGRSAGDPGGSLLPEELPAPREPLPRDVLHVPRAAPVR